MLCFVLKLSKKIFVLKVATQETITLLNESGCLWYDSLFCLAWASTVVFIFELEGTPFKFFTETWIVLPYTWLNNARTPTQWHNGLLDLSLLLKNYTNEMINIWPRLLTIVGSKLSVSTCSLGSCMFLFKIILLPPNLALKLTRVWRVVNPVWCPFLKKKKLVWCARILVMLFSCLQWVEFVYLQTSSMLRLKQIMVTAVLMWALVFHLFFLVYVT